MVFPSGLISFYVLVCFSRMKLHAVNRVNWKVKRGFFFLQHFGLSIGIFVFDRHRDIARWIRENCVNTTHYFDIWVVARSQAKKLLALS